MKKMKKLIVLCVLIVGSLVANAQVHPFKGFFKPVENDLFTNPIYLKGPAPVPEKAKSGQPDNQSVWRREIKAPT